jgi:hypothetical protein
MYYVRRSGMSDLYDEMERLRNEYRSGEIRETLYKHGILLLLEGNGIRIRPKNKGELREINTSVPITEEGVLQLGFRYDKGDNYSEDNFLFRKGSQEIEKYYRGKLEPKYPEYKGTHKLPPHLGQYPVYPRDLGCNTISIGFFREDG